MFLLNSRYPLFYDTFFLYFNIKEKVPFIPKLQGQFAEFLQQCSLKHLSLLDLPTCVGFQYGYISLLAFSWKLIFLNINLSFVT